MFDVDMFLTNIVTWQFLDSSCEFQQAHPKSLVDTTKFGYWSPALGFTPFTPWLGNELTTQPANKEYSNLKNGFVVSFVKLLMNQYLEVSCGSTNQQAVYAQIYRQSLSKLVDYLIDLTSANLGGVPDSYPPLPVDPTNPNATFTSLQQGNYLNYLKILDCILNNPNVRNIVDDTRIASLQTNYNTALTLLLSLQVQCGGTLTIWAEFYDPAAANAPVPNGNGPTGITSLLSVPESVEILVYLMNMTNPTSGVKAAIKAGIQWLQLNKLDKYVQYFDDVNSLMKIVKNNYPTVPSQDVLHPHYYSITGITSPTVSPAIPPCGPLFYKLSTPQTIYSTDVSVFPANFNTESFADQIDQFGTWAQCALNMYNEWSQIYDSSCSTTNGLIGCPCYCKSSKCKKSCRSC